MSRTGRRLFTLGTWLLLLVAAAHTAGLFNKPTDAEGAALVEAMRAYRIDLGLGMHPSAYDIQIGLALTMTIFLVCLATINFAVLRNGAWVAAGVLRLLVVVNTGCMAALAILYGIYRIPPPLVSFALLTAVFTAAWVIGGREPSR